MEEMVLLEYKAHRAQHDQDSPTTSEGAVFSLLQLPNEILQEACSVLRCAKGVSAELLGYLESSLTYV